MFVEVCSTLFSYFDARIHSTDASTLVCSIHYAAVRASLPNVVAPSFCVGDGKCVGVCNASLTPAQLTLHLSAFVCDGCMNGVPLLLVDRQMALVRNSDIHCTGSSIVYMRILDCLDN